MFSYEHNCIYVFYEKVSIFLPLDKINIEQIFEGTSVQIFAFYFPTVIME